MLLSLSLLFFKNSPRSETEPMTSWGFQSILQIAQESGSALSSSDDQTVSTMMAFPTTSLRFFHALLAKAAHARQAFLLNLFVLHFLHSIDIALIMWQQAETQNDRSAVCIRQLAKSHKTTKKSRRVVRHIRVNETNSPHHKHHYYQFALITAHNSMQKCSCVNYHMKTIHDKQKMFFYS